jgi:branched-chain amino acid transport system substrate-binding protein
MRLLSGNCGFPAAGAALAIVTALALAGCDNTGTGAGRNTAGGPVLTGPGAPTRVESPLPGEIGASPPALSVPATPPVPVVNPPPAAAPSVQLTPPPEIANQIRVAILLPLSGPQAALGRAVLDSAMLALFDVANSDFALLPFDTAGTAEGAAIAAEDAVAANVKLVVGPVFSDAVAAAAPVTLRAEINMLAFSNNRGVAEPGVFLSGLLPESQLARVIDYAARHGVRRIGALIPTGPFGARALDAARLAAGAVGIEVVRSREFGPSSPEIAAAVRLISNYDERRAALLAQKKALQGLENEVSKRALNRLSILDTFGPVPFDGLIVAASGAELVNVAAQLSNYDIDTKRVRLLGLSSWAVEGTGREPALIGSWFAAPPAAFSREFNRNFQAMYETTPHGLGRAAYDLVALAAILGSQEDGPKFDRATLSSETGFAGVGGLFRFLPDGLSQRSLEVREVTPGGAKTVEPARSTFESLPN